MPKILSKAKWQHGSGDVLNYDRDPSTFYLRCRILGTDRYQSSVIPGATTQEQAQQAAIGVYARIAQPKVVTGKDQNVLSFEVVTAKDGKRLSRRIDECVREFLAIQLDRVKCGEIKQGTYEDRERFLLKYLMPYLSYIGVSQTREIRPTTFDKYNIWRSRTSKSKLTRNVELTNFSMFFSHYLVKHRLIDPDLMVMKGFLPYQKVEEEDLDANPAINPDDWRLITDSIHRWVKGAKWCNNYRVDYFRNMFWSFCLVMKNTGIRPAELRKVTWKMVEFEQETRWSETKQKEVKRWIGHIKMPARITKNKKHREVPTAGDGGERLMKWLQYQIKYCRAHGFEPPSPNELVFGMPELDWKVHSYKEYHDAWVKVKGGTSKPLLGHKFSDKPYTIYSMRSTFIEDCLLARKDVWLISRWAGHDIKVLMRHYERMDVRARSGELTDIEYGKKKVVKNVITMEDKLASYMKDEKVATSVGEEETS